MDAEVSADRQRGVLSIGSTEVSIPVETAAYEVFDDVVVAFVSTRADESEEFDVPLPDPSRNLVAFEVDGTRRWTVAPHSGPGDAAGYCRLQRFHDRCLAKRRGQDGPIDWAEIDLDTGDVVDSFPLDSLRVDGELREFPREVRRVFMYDGIALVVEDSNRETFGSYVTAFDADGTERWRRRFFSTWLLERDGRLLSMYEPRMGTNTYVEHDPETGEPVAIHDSAFSSREDLEAYLPEVWQHLVDDYLRRQVTED